MVKWYYFEVVCIFGENFSELQGISNTAYGKKNYILCQFFSKAVTGVCS